MESNIEDDEWPDEEGQDDNWDEYYKESKEDNRENTHDSVFSNMSLTYSKDRSFMFFTMEDILNKMLPAKLKVIEE